ncbi:MAG: transaldolase [Gammaproteobacteria bacterium]|jgi:transaldolase|nr:transaldolase [Gammaproteobacteria bacterium]
MGVNKVKDLKIKIYSDGADAEEIIRLDTENFVDGFTTNPTLMKTSGITDYLAFAKEVLSAVKEKSISFEVFSDELDDMYRQANILRDLGENVWVKIPVSNTKGEYTYPLIQKLSNEGVKLNITAIFTKEQIKQVYSSLNPSVNSIISIFAGRIANAGIDPEETMQYATDLVSGDENIETLWASSREVFNIIQAERCGTDIITLTPGLIKGMKDLGKNLDQYSLETVKMFYEDAQESGFTL